MAQLIDGKKISAEIKDELKERVAQLKEEGREITLAVIQVGNDKASTVYIGNKKKACPPNSFASSTASLTVAPSGMPGSYSSS